VVVDPGEVRPPLTFAVKIKPWRTSRGLHGFLFALIDKKGRDENTAFLF
jgi:hypothetical protein